eukprot:1976898-Rhodomonas_salina.1
MAAELECAGEESRHDTASNTAKNEKPKVEKIPQGGQLPAQRSLSVSEDMVPQSEAEVNQKVMEVCQELEATEETLKRHQAFLVWMDKLLKQQHGRNARLEAFGSTVCGFTTRNSDLDLTFHVVDEVSNKPFPCFVGSGASALGMGSTKPIGFVDLGSSFSEGSN